MSRCFPFPPPGYEREHRPEDSVLSKEAKHKEQKEKKEKKEKKDKDRKKDREKKEKDGSEKKRDKKDRKKHKDKKEKHKDKKKDKEDQIKDKDKSSLSEESTIATKLEERSGEKVHPEGNNKYSSFEGEGKFSTPFQFQNGKKPLIGTTLWNPSHVSAEAKHSDVDKSFHVKKLDLQCNGEFTGKAAVQNITQVANSGNEGVPKPSKEPNDLRLEDIEKHKETLGSKHGEKQKDRDKKSHRKDKHKKKEKKEEKREKKRDEKKEEKREEKTNPKIENEMSEFKIFGRNDLGSATINRSVNFPKEVVGTAIVEESIKKRKEPETNGFLHEIEIRPNKVQKLALHHSTQNGRKLEASSKYTSAVPNNIRPDLDNGTKEAKRPSPSKPNHTSGIEKLTDQISLPPKTPHHDLSNVNVAPKMPKAKDHASEASRRPPHPDSKYLNQILTVPTVGDWSEIDDQEWLFNNKRPSKKLESVGLNEELQVWSEAVHIESADVCALPYVIPY